MSHSQVVTLIADQEILFGGVEVNIHDIKSITLDGCGQIEQMCVEKTEVVPMTISAKHGFVNDIRRKE